MYTQNEPSNPKLDVYRVPLGVGGEPLTAQSRERYLLMLNAGQWLHEPGGDENPEYTRGQAELLIDSVPGFDHELKEWLMVELQKGPQFL